MKIFSHRGFHRDVPENTLEAFHRAVRLGVDGIETDVRLSADGLPILYHDRLTPSGREVSALSLRELIAELGFKVPTLDSVLEKWSNVLWNIEIKAPESLDITVKIIKAYNGTNRCLITSFCHPTIVKCSKMDVVDCGIIIAHRPTHMMSLLGEFPSRGRMNTVVWDYETLDAESATAVVDRGFCSYVYGVISPAEHQAVLALPIEAIITDYPDYLLVGALTERRP